MSPYRSANILPNLTKAPKAPWWRVLWAWYRGVLAKRLISRLRYRKEVINGNTYYFYKNELHRTNGPAIIWKDGSTAYIHHGNRLKFEIVCSDELLEVYYKDGKYHREDGPAWISPSLKPKYYLEGQYYSKEEFDREIWHRKLVKEIQ